MTRAIRPTPGESLCKNYKRFVALVLTFDIALIIVVALYRSSSSVSPTAAVQLPDLVAVTLVLGVSYWLMRERDDRLAGASEGLTT
jgi:hypothetical protein